jgi:hypothetical protein
MVVAPRPRTPQGSDRKLVLHKNFNKVDTVPLVHLRRWLSKMEPVACSEAMMYMVCKHGKREENRAHLAQLFEYMTDIQANQPLFEGGRSQEQMEQFEQTLIELNMKSGRRARDLTLPVTFGPGCGVYYAVQKVTGVFIVHRVLNVEVELPDNIKDDVKVIHDLVFNDVFSQWRATVRSKSQSCIQAFSVFQLFRQLVKVAPLIESGSPLEVPARPSSASSAHSPKALEDLGVEGRFEASIGNPGKRLLAITDSDQGALMVAITDGREPTVATVLESVAAKKPRPSAAPSKKPPMPALMDEIGFMPPPPPSSETASAAAASGE